MGSLKQNAENYTSSKMRNVSELENVEVDNAVMVEEKTRSDGTTYIAQYIVVDGEQYRVPDSVLAQLKEILEEKPKLKSFKVKRKGTTKEDTKYTIVTLD